MLKTHSTDLLIKTLAPLAEAEDAYDMHALMKKLYRHKADVMGASALREDNPYLASLGGREHILGQQILPYVEQNKSDASRDSRYIDPSQIEAVIERVKPVFGMHS